jgi:hypothetical protein
VARTALQIQTWVLGHDWIKQFGAETRPRNIAMMYVIKT